MPLRQNISSDEGKRIKELALRISFQISTDCGPLQTESTNGQKHEHTTIFGFNAPKSREIIEDMIWEFLMKD